MGTGAADGQPTDGGAFDLIVAGAGLAGSVAALVATQGGKRVLLLDAATDPSIGSNSAFSGGRMHIAHAELHAEPDEIRRRIMGRAHGEVRTEVVDAIANTAGTAATWLVEQGVDLGGDAPGGVGSILEPERLLTDSTEPEAWHERGPHLALRRLQAVASDLGATILPATRAEELVTTPDGAIEGVKTDGGDTFRAPVVVLADGGFHGDPELVKQYLTPAPEKLFMRGAPLSSGSGLRMAQSAGAKLVNMEWLYAHCLHADTFHNDRLWPYPILDPVLTLGGGILVGADGRRFVDEGLGGPHVTNHVARLDDPLSTWVVLDEGRWDDTAGQNVLGMEPFKLAFERRGARVERAPDAASLAAAIGVDAAGLAETVSAYSDAIDAGAADKLPVTRTGELQPLRGGLVGLPLAVGLSYTLGGPAIDADGRVLSEDGPIPGLFAAGGCAANGSGGYYGGLATALTIGWRAGQAIVRGEG